ncbi:hypothetical protein D3C81_1653840 [compost metagenome]
MKDSQVKNQEGQYNSKKRKPKPQVRAKDVLKEKRIKGRHEPLLYSRSQNNYDSDMAAANRQRGPASQDKILPGTKKLQEGKFF